MTRRSPSALPPPAPLNPRTAWTTCATVAFGLVLLLAGLRAAPAAASPDQAISIEVTDVSSLVPADGKFVIEVELTPTDLGRGDQTGTDVIEYELAVSVFAPVESVDELSRPLTDPISRLNPVPLAELPPKEDGRYTLELPIRSGEPFDQRSRVQLPEPGVYPVLIELRSTGPSGELWASRRVNLIRLPADNADAHSTADTGAESEPSGAFDVGVLLTVSPAEGLTVSEATGLLARHPDLPLTVMLQEGVLGQLEADDELTTAFAEAVNGRPVLAAPSVDLDPSALADIGYGELFQVVLDDETDTIDALGLTPASDVALVDSPLTAHGVSTLAGLGVKTVVRTNGVALVGNGAMSATGPAGSVNVVSVDPEITRILAQDDTGPVRANRILAHLALSGAGDDRPVVLGGPVTGRDLGAVFDPLLAGFSRSDGPRPVLLGELDAGRFELRPAERPAQDLSAVAEELAQTLDRIATYEDFHMSGNPGPDYFTRQALTSLAVNRNPTDRLRALRTAERELDHELQVIHLPEGQPLTMAAQRASIPLIVENRAGGPRRILLRFRSDRVTVAQNEMEIVIEPGVSSIDLDVTARSLGSTTLSATAWTTDGKVQLAGSDFRVRSTAIPGLSLTITLSAFGLLGLWWWLDSRKRRRRTETTESEPRPGPVDGSRPVVAATEPRSGSDDRRRYLVGQSER